MIDRLFSVILPRLGNVADVAVHTQRLRQRGDDDRPSGLLALVPDKLGPDHQAYGTLQDMHDALIPCGS